MKKIPKMKKLPKMKQKKKEKNVGENPKTMLVLNNKSSRIVNVSWLKTKEFRFFDIEVLHDASPGVEATNIVRDKTQED